MDGLTQHTVELPTGRLEFCDVGSGIPVLYFHGTGAGNAAAVLLEQRLVTSGCRLIIPNRPGYGHTPLGIRGSAAHCSQLAVELLDHLQLPRVAVIGTSGGGMPATAFARQNPARTASLILQCAQSHRWDDARWLPAGIGPALPFFRHSFCYPLLRLYNRIHARSARLNPLALLRSMSGSAARRLAQDDEVMRVIRTLAKITADCAARPLGIENDWHILVGDNGLHPQSIAAPTLIIHDRSDPLVPFAHAEWSHSSIPQSQFLEAQGSGHLIWYGPDSQLMHEQRMEFLKTHPSSGTDSANQTNQSPVTPSIDP